MNFGIAYNKTFQYWDNENVTDVYIDFLDADYPEIIEELKSFVQKMKQRVNLFLLVEDIQIWKEAQYFEYMDNWAEKNNITNLVYAFEGFDPECAELSKNIPFYFNTPATTIALVKGMIHMGVSDIIVAEDLGFCLDIVKNLVKDKNIKIQVYANVSQSSCPWFDKSISTFFIPPDGVSQYEEYIDIIRFFAEEGRANTLYGIYNKGHWEGPLSAIIAGLDVEVESHRLVADFYKSRINCHKKCDYSRCNMCAAAETLAATMQRAGLVSSGVTSIVDENEEENEIDYAFEYWYDRAPEEEIEAWLDYDEDQDIENEEKYNATWEALNKEEQDAFIKAFNEK